MGQKQVSCDCGKTIRGETDDLLIERVKEHAKEVHNLELTKDQILSMAEPA